MEESLVCLILKHISVLRRAQDIKIRPDWVVFLWRRGKDSNLRRVLPLATLAMWCLRPLGHLSVYRICYPSSPICGVVFYVWPHRTDIGTPRSSLENSLQLDELSSKSSASLAQKRGTNRKKCTGFWVVVSIARMWQSICAWWGARVV